MGRSQVGLRDASRRGVDSRGETYEPGSDYTRDWKATWPSGSLARHSATITIDGTTIPANTGALAEATASLSIDGTVVSTSAVVVDAITRAAALALVATAIDGLTGVASAVVNGTNIVVTGATDVLLADGEIVYDATP